MIRIEWPNGVLQSEFDRPAKTTIAASQRLKGSCPWLFAWNGREMAFVTDLIWRSPLGLRINAQDTADVLTTEDWVKVRGDQLAARDGAYDLRITAELWETHFFDLVSLMAVDHPAGTEVLVDERFAVPTPTLAPIVTGPVQPLAAARDDRGQDVSALVRGAGRSPRRLRRPRRLSGRDAAARDRADAAGDGAAQRPAVADRARLGASDRQLGERGDGAGAPRAAAGPRARGRRPATARSVPSGPAWGSRRARTRRCCSISPACSRPAPPARAGCA